MLPLLVDVFHERIWIKDILFHHAGSEFKKSLSYRVSHSFFNFNRTIKW